MQADDCEDGDQCIAQGVPPKGLARGEALGAGGADVVFVQGIQKGRAHDARKDRGLGQGEGDGGQGEGFHGGVKACVPAGEPACREPAQVDGKDQHHQQREPEVRDGDAQLRGTHDGDIGEGAAFCGGQNADGEGDKDGEGQGVEREGEGDHQPFGHDFRHGRTIGVRGAKVSGQ